MEVLQPMLAVTAREPFDAPDYLFEVKWDGIRALSCRDNSGWRLWGRDGADYRPHYPELAVLAALPAGTMLDGEIVLCCHGVPNLSMLLTRHGRVAAPTSHHFIDQPPVSYLVFDALYDAGHCLLSRPLTERDRGIVEDIMIGERTRDVANKYKVSAARISQKRREYLRGWQAFSGERPEVGASSSTIGIA
jgi:bifunctional non-homologous end joining protein LigD